MLKKLWDNYKNKNIYFIGFLYLISNVYVLLFKRDYFYAYQLLPFLLIGAYVFIYHWEYLMLFLSFITPLSISLKDLNLTEGANLSLPSEPIMAAFTLMYLIHSFIGKSDIEKNFSRHPMTILIILQTIWIFITALTSVDFIVSVKFFIARLWFVVSCYFIVFYLFKNRGMILPFIISYLLSLLVVCIYTIYHHATYGFDHKSADWVMSPFYNDHTAYGAALGIFLPFAFAMIFFRKFNPFVRLIFVFVFVFMLFALVLSYARAAWLSLAVAFLVFITWLLRIRFFPLLFGFISVLIVVFAFQEELLYLAGKNTTDAEEGLWNNVKSISNISSDASNLERLNRWSCAVRMWADKPFLGWGPGTYMFNYASYQLSKEKTIISTNFGTNGNAHSEYLGPLVEQGILGLIFMLVMLFMITYYGYKIFYNEKNPDDKVFFAGIFLGLFSYFIHGFINNFLDTDKLSLPFWAFVCLIVIFDLKQKNNEKIFG
ncbi:MAG: O-antigen ligase family protein [Bacteroidia bacterium]|nr:O-antigen ligase family protein [Bacteroidia bacterium]